MNLLPSQTKKWSWVIKCQEIFNLLLSSGVESLTGLILDFNPWNALWKAYRFQLLLNRNTLLLLYIHNKVETHRELIPLILYCYWGDSISEGHRGKSEKCYPSTWFASFTLVVKVHKSWNLFIYKLLYFTVYNIIFIDMIEHMHVSISRPQLTSTIGNKNFSC